MFGLPVSRNGCILHRTHCWNELCSYTGENEMKSKANSVNIQCSVKDIDNTKILVSFPKARQKLWLPLDLGVYLFTKPRVNYIYNSKRGVHENEHPPNRLNITQFLSYKPE